jgi:spore coat protein U-like protein
MMQRWTLLLCFCIAGLAIPAPAEAALKCTVSTVGVAFGAYDVFSSSPLASAGSVTVSCKGAKHGLDPISVSLSSGNSGSFQPRKMFRGFETLDYNLYLDPGNTQIWGNGTGGSLRYNSVASNGPITLNIFGRIPAGQDISAGTYSDTIVVTLDF